MRSAKVSQDTHFFVEKTFEVFPFFLYTSNISANDYHLLNFISSVLLGCMHLLVSAGVSPEIQGGVIYIKAHTSILYCTYSTYHQDPSHLILSKESNLILQLVNQLATAPFGISFCYR